MDSGSDGLTGNQNNPNPSSCWQLLPPAWRHELDSPPRNGTLVCEASLAFVPELTPRWNDEADKTPRPARAAGA